MISIARFYELLSLQKHTSVKLWHVKSDHSAERVPCNFVYRMFLAYAPKNGSYVNVIQYLNMGTGMYDWDLLTNFHEDKPTEIESKHYRLITVFN